MQLSCLARNLHYTVRDREDRVVRSSGAAAKAMMTAALLAGFSAMAAETRAGQAAVAGPSQAASETPPEASGQPPRSSRLKFRSGGPVCNCATGLGEADIQAAERRRRHSAAGLRPIVPDQ